MTSVWCSGRACDGQLGEHDTDIFKQLRLLSVPDVTSNNIRDIPSNKRQSAILTRDGLVYTAGKAEVLGRKGIPHRHSILQSLEMHIIKAISFGDEHCVVATSSGALYCWGYNSRGQCGQENEEYVPKPKIVSYKLGFKVLYVACGSHHTLALCTTGEVVTWGDNSCSQLGRKADVQFSSQPALVDSLTGLPVVQISAGSKHNAVLTVSGAVLVWGGNSFGQLGLGDNRRRAVPREVPGMSGLSVKTVKCGEYFTVALNTRGGVFTWGDNTFGQLGHGNNTPQLIPRQVFELMGEQVDLIACGYNHVVAVIADKVYGWGSCCAGQLGIDKVAQQVNLPQVLPAPWTSGTEARYHPCDVFCGGDQTFIRVSDEVKSLSSQLRQHDIEEAKVISAVKDFKEDKNPTSLIEYISSVFGSLSCVNSVCVTPFKPVNTEVESGVDILRLRKVMSHLKQLNNRVYLDAMSDLLVSKILPSLNQEMVASPEQLRVFTVLPEFRSLVYPYNHVPLYTSSILSLPDSSLKRVLSWFSKYEKPFYEGLVTVIKNGISKCLLLRYHTKPENELRSRNIASCLKFLYKLNEINAIHEIVPYNTFYIYDLLEHLDLELDYRNWMEGREVSFCQYPFVFTAGAKAKLLTIDANHQMMRTVKSFAYKQLIASSGPVEINPFLEIEVSRDNIMEDTLVEIRKCEAMPYVLKKPLKVKFKGEEGYDAGGVKKELFLLLLKELLSPSYGMFTVDDESRFLWFSEYNFEGDTAYELIGIICGLAIYNSIIVDINFPPALYKKLLKKPIGLKDLAKLYPTRGESLNHVLLYNEPDFETVMCLTFSITRDVFGQVEEVDLIENGSNIPVTLENKQEYVDAYVDYYLNQSIKAQFKAFAHGFMFVAGGQVFDMFHADELMHMISGLKDFNFRELETITEYANGYTRQHPTIRIFWEVFHEMDLETKKKFLIFLTGSDRIPIHGIHSIKLAIALVLDTKRLPVAHTCFNILDLPPYQDKATLKHKLYQAINNTEGFGLV